MKPLQNTKLWILFLLLLTGLPTLFGQMLGRETRVDSVLASVNGDPITLLDVIFEYGGEEYKLTSMFSGERLYTEVEKLRRDMIEQIILRKLVYDVYKENPFKIEKQYIEDMLDMLASSIGDGTREGLQRKAAGFGLTMDDLRENALERLAVDAILSEYCDRMVNITPKEVYEAYEKNPAKWTLPATVELQLLQILLTGARSGDNAEETVKTIDELLKKAQADKNPDVFKRVVAQYSDGPNKENGGSVGEVEQNKLRPEFAEALKDLKEGLIVGPLKTPEAYYFIRVLKLSAEQMVPFDEVSEQIKARLYNDAAGKKRREYADKLRSKALIRYFFN